MSFIECELHKNFYQDRLCVSEHCKILDPLICLHCTDSHYGRAVQIKKIIENLSRSIVGYQSVISENEEGCHSSKFLEQTRNNFIELRKQVDRVEKELILRIEEIFNQEQAGLNFRDLFSKYQNISIETINKDQELQQNLIRFQFNQNQNIPDLQEQLQQSFQKYLQFQRNFESSILVQLCNIGSMLKQLPTLIQPRAQRQNPPFESLLSATLEWESPSILTKNPCINHMIQINQRQILVSKRNKELCLVNLESGIQQLTYTGFGANCTLESLFKISENLIGARSGASQILIFDKESTQLFQTIQLQQKHSDIQNDLCIYNNQRNLLIATKQVGEQNYSLVIFEMELKSSQFKYFSKQIDGSHEQSINSLLLVDQNTCVTGSYDRTLRLRDIETQKSQVLVKESYAICNLKKLDRNIILYEILKGDIIIYDIQLKRKLRQFSTRTNETNDIGNPSNIQILSVDFLLITKDLLEPSLEVLDMRTGKSTCLEWFKHKAASTLVLQNQSIVIYSNKGLFKYKI